MSKITVYHGCNLKYVNDIKSEIAFSFSKPKPKKPEDGDEPEDPSLFASRWGGKQYPSDFTAKSEGRGFYTTKDAGYAQWWAEEVAKKNTKILAAAVIEFELDLKDLRVFDFGTSEQGPTYEKWQQFVFNNYDGQNPDHRGISGYDVITGYMSNADQINWDTKPSPSAKDIKPFARSKFFHPMTQVAARTTKAIEMERWTYKGTKIYDKLTGRWEQADFKSGAWVKTIMEGGKPKTRVLDINTGRWE